MPTNAISPGLYLLILVAVVVLLPIITCVEFSKKVSKKELIRKIPATHKMKETYWGYLRVVV
jgi:hypothetical protein